MTKQHRTVSEIMTGALILFSAIAYSLYTLQQVQSGQSGAFETLLNFGFCGVILLAAFAQITGSQTYLRMVWFFIGIGLFSVGGMVSYKWSIPGVLAVLETKNWLETPCIIMTSEVLREKMFDGDVIRKPNIRYKYEIGGQSYESDVVDVFWVSISGGMDAQKIVNAFSVEKETICWINPENHHESTLQRGWQPMHYGAFLPLLLFIPGVAMMIAAFWKKKE
ncbi:MAG: hypothetical protein ACMUIP_08985 [bacterium]